MPHAVGEVRKPPDFTGFSTFLQLVERYQTLLFSKGGREKRKLAFHGTLVRGSGGVFICYEPVQAGFQTGCQCLEFLR